MNTRILNILYYIFWIAALIAVIYRLYLRSNHRNDEATTMVYVAIGLLVAAVLCRYLPKIFPGAFRGNSVDDNMRKSE